MLGCTTDDKMLFVHDALSLHPDKLDRFCKLLNGLTGKDFGEFLSKHNDESLKALRILEENTKQVLAIFYAISTTT